MRTPRLGVGDEMSMDNMFEDCTTDLAAGVGGLQPIIPPTNGLLYSLIFLGVLSRREELMLWSSISHRASCKACHSKKRHQDRFMCPVAGRDMSRPR